MTYFDCSNYFKLRPNFGLLPATCLPKVSFSPESGGRVNPNRAIDEIKTQGMMRLLK